MSLLINIEGIDGSGKSTLARTLAGALGAVLTTEPTRGPHGSALRAAFAAGQRLPRDEERRLFELDRRMHMETFINVRLAAGEVIVSDRSYYSSAAYQGTTDASAIAIVRDNERFARRPDFVLYLDVPPGTALARIQARGEGVTAMETAINLVECARRYEAIWSCAELLQGTHFVRIDGTASPDDVASAAMDAIRSCGRLPITPVSAR